MPDSTIEERMSEAQPPVDAATAASLEELSRQYEIERIRFRATRCREAADMIEEFLPKTAAALWGHAHSAMKDWSRMVDSTGAED